MSFSRYCPSAGVLAVGPALVLLAGCSSGTPAEGTPQAAATPAPSTAPATTNKPVASTAARPASADYDRYANPAPAAPAAKPAIDFDGEAFKSAVANESVVGDRYSR